MPVLALLDGVGDGGATPPPAEDPAAVAAARRGCWRDAMVETEGGSRGDLTSPSPAPLAPAAVPYGNGRFLPASPLVRSWSCEEGWSLARMGRRLCPASSSSSSMSSSPSPSMAMLNALVGRPSSSCRSSSSSMAAWSRGEAANDALGVCRWRISRALAAIWLVHSNSGGASGGALGKISRWSPSPPPPPSLADGLLASSCLIVTAFPPPTMGASPKRPRLNCSRSAMEAVRRAAFASLPRRESGSPWLTRVLRFASEGRKEAGWLGGGRRDRANW
mmetsp:Transcript_33048/g.95381  ORF Transcript_33048/g.95381 Transcript_33048/m.95381 type:complete len:276 (+) Transcript_33048:321-1148(+)